MFQSKMIVEAHGGNIQVTSDVGRGTTFSVFLPLKTGCSMKAGLLIVDDDEEIRTQMKWALANDYELAFADGRTAALAGFRESKPTVTLLDLGLPPRPNDPEEGLARSRKFSR